MRFFHNIGTYPSCAIYLYESNETEKILSRILVQTLCEERFRHVFALLQDTSEISNCNVHYSASHVKQFLSNYNIIRRMVNKFSTLTLKID